MAARKIWGFEITTSPSGKNIWPAKLKKEAVRRIDEEGTSPGELAAELGAHECLVRKWHVAARRTRGDMVLSNGPAFAEVTCHGIFPPPSIRVRPNLRADNEANEIH